MLEAHRAPHKTPHHLGGLQIQGMHIKGVSVAAAIR